MQRCVQGRDKMQEPSVYERALLAIVLRETLASQDVSKIAESFVLLMTCTEVQQTMRALRNDEQVLRTTITFEDIEAASLSNLCATLWTVTTDDKNVVMMCERIRTYLPCADLLNSKRTAVQK